MLKVKITDNSLKCLIFILFILSFVRLHDSLDSKYEKTYLKEFRSDFQPANFSEIYNGIVQNGEVHTYRYKYNIDPYNQTYGIRVEVTSLNATRHFPVLFVVRQSRSVLSWQIPLVLDGVLDYQTVAHTLCPLQNYLNSSYSEVFSASLDIDISSESPQSLGYSMQASYITPFLLRNNDKPVHLNVSASTPHFLQYNFPPDHDYVQIQVESEDRDGCMVVSIQNIQCPVFDLDMNVGFRGLYQTMTKKASITVQREYYKEGKFYVVLVMKPNNQECRGLESIRPGNHISKEKPVRITAHPTISAQEYIRAAIFALLFFALFYLFSFIVHAIYFIKSWKNPSEVSLMEQAEISANIQNYGALPASTGSSQQNLAPSSIEDNDDSDTVLDETDLDMLDDADIEKDVVRTKTFLYVSDLSRKKEKRLERKAKLYSRNLLTIAIFYAIPVVQLVYTYQKVLRMTGNQDICYYNFLCAHPFRMFTDFNHVFSNIGYILLGLLFLFLVWRREKIYLHLASFHPRLRKYYGIPQHFGMFYSMGLALIMEGVLSGCYHICPNYSNFQFDTAFMYIIATLYMLKIYQTRHPDINAHSHNSYLILALVVAVGVFGVLNGTVYFWLVFAAIHLVVCFCLSAQIYYMGRWKLDLGCFKRTYLMVKHDLSSGRLAPMYLDRFILLILGNAFNWGWLIYGLIHRPRDFSSFLLAIFMANLVLYLVFYIIMKLRHGERILLLPLCYIVLSFITWVSSLFFFLHKNTTWQTSPAMSRELNNPCIILNFYDHHDIWHFLSSSALFFSFMVLLTLDDDLLCTPREKIPVF